MHALLNGVGLAPRAPVKAIPFSLAHVQSFRHLNWQWLMRYDLYEPEADEAVLIDPSILERSGYIDVAVCSEKDYHALAKDVSVNISEASASSASTYKKPWDAQDDDEVAIQHSPDGIVCGTACLSPYAMSGAVASSLKRHGVSMEHVRLFEVMKFCVDERLQGYGVGGMLLRSVIERAIRDLPSDPPHSLYVKLYTSTKLAAAGHLYCKMGFALCDEIIPYYTADRAYELVIPSSVIEHWKASTAL